MRLPLRSIDLFQIDVVVGCPLAVLLHIAAKGFAMEVFRIAVESLGLEAFAQGRRIESIEGDDYATDGGGNASGEAGDSGDEAHGGCCNEGETLEKSEAKVGDWLTSS